MHITKENRHKVIMLLAYVGMLAIQIVVTVLDNINYYHLFPLSIPKGLLKYILIGFLFYLVPYKRIQHNVRTRIFNICKHFHLDGDWYDYFRLVLNCAIALLIFVLISRVQTHHLWYFSYFRINKYVPIILSAYALIRFLRDLKDTWSTYILCCYIWTPIVVIFTYIITERFVFSGIVGISMLLTYMIGIRRMSQKKHWLRVIICLLIACLALWYGMVFSHNTQNLLGIFYPDKYISDSVSNMIYFIWKNPLFTAPEKASYFFYSEHPLTAINMYLGAPALILFLAFQVIFIIYLFLTWIDALKKSETGGLLFGYLGLHFIGIYLYVFLGDIGAIPATTIHYMYMSIDIPILFLMIRLTNMDSVYGVTGPIAKALDTILSMLAVTAPEYDLDELDDIDNFADSLDVTINLDTQNENPLPKPNSLRSSIDKLLELSEKNIQDSYHEKENSEGNDDEKKGDDTVNGK